MPTNNAIYPTASRPGPFFGTAKLHKLQEGCTNGEQLPVRPIISNIGTATYTTSKHLTKLLAPLTKPTYTVKEFIAFTKNAKVRQEYDKICFQSFYQPTSRFHKWLDLEESFPGKEDKNKAEEGRTKGAPRNLYKRNAFHYRTEYAWARRVQF